jgi:endonuclease YncB( thermonuclease family)
MRDGSSRREGSVPSWSGTLDGEGSPPPPAPRPRRRLRGILALVAVIVLTVPVWAPDLASLTSPAAPTYPSAAKADSDGRVKARAVGTAAKAQRRRKAKTEQRRARQTATKPATNEVTATTWRVVSVTDGDTLDVVDSAGRRETVRVIGIDTPERGECGYSEAGAALAGRVVDRDVQLSPGAVDDRDRYGRILRYVDADGGDAGLAMLQGGFAIARYDSRDGHGAHPREQTYVSTDQATPHICGAGAPADVQQVVDVPAGADGAWGNCTEARNAGAAPVYSTDAGYGSHLDGDGDGVGCE